MSRKQTNSQQRRTPSKRVTREERRNSLAKRDFNDKFEYERESKVVNILPKTQAQQDFLQVMRDNQCALGIGSAGGGKTYLAGTFIANEYLKNPDMKILLSRPYVPMGGRTVGFLTGGVEQKLEAFVAAQTSVLRNHLGRKFDADFGTNINIQLLEAVRGLDLKNTWLWVDECQLLTRDEFKCILTRVSSGGKVIFTGDPAQGDLKGEISGLDWVCDMIEKHNVKGCDFVEFTDDDCVRSGMVKDWLRVFRQEDV
jgi:phosphate starvation-inducible PhoH-like protein